MLRRNRQSSFNALQWIACCAVAAAAVTTSARAAESASASLALADRHAFAELVTAGATSDLERAQALASWFARNFDWTATDYQQRTVDQILERQGGNCAELARVTTAMFEELGMRMRRVREINLHVESAERRESARAKIAELGNRASVFGKRHNDHVWIEIQDRATGEWFPADPSLGVVGEEAWIAARLGFGERFTLDPSSEDMIAPFAIFGWEEDGRVEDRTAHYAVEGFDRLYDGRLSELPAWAEWVQLLDELGDKALGAFRGEVNLHDSEAQIDALARTYERLREEWAAE